MPSFLDPIHAISQPRMLMCDQERRAGGPAPQWSPIATSVALGYPGAHVDPTEPPLTAEGSEARHIPVRRPPSDCARRHAEQSRQLTRAEHRLVVGCRYVAA